MDLYLFTNFQIMVKVLNFNFFMRFMKGFRKKNNSDLLKANLFIIIIS
jgi:hypothetical protein